MCCVVLCLLLLMSRCVHGVFTLNNGVSIPRLGLGTYKLTDKAALKGAIKAAYSLGYRCASDVVTIT